MFARRGLVGGVLALCVGVSAGGCNGLTGVSDLTVGSGGAGSTSSGSSSTSATSSSGATGSSSSGAQSSSSSSATSSSSGATSSSSSSTSSSSTSSGSSTDPFEQYRKECIDTINTLRATKTGLSPYQRWTSAEACVDQQATHDASVGIAHDAWSTANPSCGGYGQNECPGWSAGSISSCLQQMWAEGDQPGCAGCDACDTFTIFGGSCPNCTFNGSVVCGHYVNMSSKSFTMAACGFGSGGSWEAINFQ